MTPVAACECQGIEQPWHAMIEDGSVVAARFVAERAGKPTFAGAGRTSVTMPGVRRSRYGFSIRFIHGPGRWCRSSTASGSLARTIWSWSSPTARSP